MRVRRRRGAWLWLLFFGLIALGLFLARLRRDQGAAEDARKEGLDRLPLVSLDLPPGDVAAGEIVVQFRDGVSAEAAQGDARAAGLDVSPVDPDSPGGDELYLARVPPAREAAALDALRAEGDVAEAEPDILYALPSGEALDEAEEAAAAAVRATRASTPGAARRGGAPNDPLYRYQWHLRQIGVEQAWRDSEGEGVTVAVIDTGVAFEDRGRFHRVPDLAGVEVVSPWNFIANDAHPDDDHGHGTHVAGTIAQATNNDVGVAGIAYRARLMPLKVLSAQGSGSVASIAAALRYAATHGATVANLSLGGPIASRILARAVAYAHDHGVVVVCAAGNDGREHVSFPAAFPGAIAVAATQLDGATTFYSNWGRAIDLAAPGGNTREDKNGDGMPDGVVQNTLVPGDVTRDDYLPFMGTSMAAPHVAGAAALVEAAGVTDPDAVETILEETARVPAGHVKGDLHYGAGVVDAAAAAEAAVRSNGWWSLFCGLGLAGLALGRLRARDRAAFGLRPSLLGGLVVGASGLFFLRGLLPESWPHVRDLVASGFPAWGESLLGTGAVGSPLLYSALVPAFLVVLLWGVPRARAAAAGFAFGVAGALLAALLHPTVVLHFVPAVLVAPWLLLNALACVGLGALSARR